ncbi:MAG TPA: BTAD domain-containing putative transcriptional regulator [Limnochordales bacterium]|nr:BTAD domain-containing putative transcriptional regulator [Limnochordales bacterium]
MAYRLLMLGPPVLMRGSEVIAFRSRKGQAFLWYLAAQPDAMFPRDHLYQLLWDGIPADSARRDFNTMLSRLRAETPAEFWQQSWDRLGWNPAAPVATDLADFLRWTEQAGLPLDLGTPPYPTLPEDKELLYQAAALWRGPFLDGFTCDSAAFEKWMAGERHRWQLRMLAVLSRLVEAERAEGRWAQVLAVARRALEIDPLQEPFHRAIMEALYRQGNRSAALAEFERCARLLRERLGTAPDAATLALAETIRRAAHPGAAAPAEQAANSTETTALPSRAVLAPGWSRTGSAPPLIGRTGEWDRILQALRGAARPDFRHLILLQGEAGIGKTRLLAEVVEAASRGAAGDAGFATVLAGEGYESMAGVPYAPIVEALTPVVPELLAGHILLPDIWLRELGRLLPDIYAHRPELYPPLPMTSADDRLRLFQAAARLLSSLPQPVLLVLDDLHWVDALTMSLLDYLLRQPSAELRLAVVAAVREDEESDALRQVLTGLEREGCLTRMPLANLTEADTVALVEILSPAGGPLLGRRIYAQTLGHPLYTVELVAMLLQAGEDGPVAQSLPVPPTVQNVVVDRLTRLGEAAMEVAETLAVFGRGATVDQLTRATGRDEGALVAALGALRRAGITVENGPGVGFRHDLFRQVVLERMPSSRLTSRHRQAYAALAETLPAPAHAQTGSPGPWTGPNPAPHPTEPTPTAQSMEPARATQPLPPVQPEPPVQSKQESVPQPANLQLLASLVAHAVGGQLWAQAVHWARRAAAAAQAVYAFRAAADYLNTARDCLERLPPTDAYLRQRLDIELDLARLDQWSPPAQRDDRLAAALRLAQEMGAVEYLPRLHMAQADSLVLQGRLPEASALLERLAPWAEQDPRLGLVFHAWQGAIHTLIGDVRSAIHHFLKVRSAADAAVLKPGTSLDGGLAACWAAAGDFAQADAALTAMERDERAQGYPTLTSKFLVIAATVEYLRGRWREAAAMAAQGLHTAREAQDTANEAHCALWLGASLLELAEAAACTEEEHGRHDGEHAQLVWDGRPLAATPTEAIGFLEIALAASERAQAYTRREFIYAFLGAAYARAGEPEKADAAVAAGLQLADRFGFREGRAMCTEALGRIAACRGDLEAARRSLGDAAAQFEALGNVAGARRCRQRLARL